MRHEIEVDDDVLRIRYGSMCELFLFSKEGIIQKKQLRLEFNVASWCIWSDGYKSESRMLDQIKFAYEDGSGLAYVDELRDHPWFNPRGIHFD